VNGRQRTFGFAAPPAREAIASDAWLLRGFALPDVAALVAAIDEVAARAPFRHMVTPGGHPMSVAMTNCGALGWVTDARGYRYTAEDPATGAPWPAMPSAFLALAQRAAAAAGHAAFAPDACLVNRYEPGARMTLHQDKNERDFGAPIVSVSLGLPATFLFGGLERAAPARRVLLQHGDVVVWGGPSRLRFHGVLPLRDGAHDPLGRCRINLTFRVAG
jgi:alkylated DNA repair protein (DNA oxidative demethylase)